MKSSGKNLILGLLLLSANMAAAGDRLECVTTEMSKSGEVTHVDSSCNLDLDATSHNCWVLENRLMINVRKVAEFQKTMLGNADHVLELYSPKKGAQKSEMSAVASEFLSNQTWVIGTANKNSGNYFVVCKQGE